MKKPKRERKQAGVCAGWVLSGLGGRWCHSQCDICWMTAPPLLGAPPHLSFLLPLLPSPSLPPSPRCPGATPELIKTSFSLFPSYLLCRLLTLCLYTCFTLPLPTAPSCICKEITAPVSEQISNFTWFALHPDAGRNRTWLSAI